MLLCDFSNLKTGVGALSYPANHSQFCILEKIKFENIEAVTEIIFGIGVDYSSQFFHLMIADVVVINVSLLNELFLFTNSQVTLLRNVYFERVNARFYFIIENGGRYTDYYHTSIFLENLRIVSTISDPMNRLIIN